MQTKIRNKQGAGLNISNISSSLNELDTSSPITPSKAFAVRNFKKDQRVGSGSNTGFTSTMSPTANLGRFQINLQMNGGGGEDLRTNSMMGKNGAKLLPLVNSPSKTTQKDESGLPVPQSRTLTQTFDKAFTNHSPNQISRGDRMFSAQSMSGVSAGGRSKTPSNQVVLSSFGGFDGDNSEEELVEHTGFCYLKTKTESYKKHFMHLQGNELRFYRKQGEEEAKVMHCLAGTYLKEVTMDEISEKSKSSSKSKSKASSSKRSGPEETKRREKE